MSDNADEQFNKRLMAVGNKFRKKNMDDIAGVYDVEFSDFHDNGFELLLRLKERKKFTLQNDEVLRNILKTIGRLDLIDVLGAIPRGPLTHEYERKVMAFIARELENEMVEKFTPIADTTEDTAYYALVGEGGIGKTQLALRYCELMSHVYDVIWFMSGDGFKRFAEDMEDLLDELEIEYKGVSPKTLKRTLSRKLNGRGKWLLVVDNFEGMDLKEIEDRIPEQGGVVLMTSRDLKVLPDEDMIEVTPFTDEEAFRMFEKIVGVDKVSESLVKEVGELLGHNTFALSICAYYIHTTSITDGVVAKKEIMKRMKEMFTEMKQKHRKETVQAIYGRSLLKLETDSPAAWRLLCKLSLVSPDGVDMDIIGGMDDDHTPCMGEILRLGLAEKRGDKYYVHRLMMGVVQERMRKSIVEFTSVLEEVIEDIHRMWIWDLRDYTHWKKIQEMGEHVGSLAIHEKHLSNAESRERLVYRLYDYSWYTIEVKGDFATAEERITKAEQVEGGGKCSKEVRAALKGVRGDLRRHQGKYTEAIAEYRAALELEPGKALFFNRLGICLFQLQKYPEALEEYEKSLEIDIKYKGEDSTDVSYTLNNIGGCLFNMGRYEEAVEKQTRALEIRESKYGQVNPVVANGYINIGVCYQRLKKYEDALEMDEKALEIFRKVYGEGVDHPDLASSIQHCGISMRNLGRVEKAKPLLEEAYKMRKRMQGEDHPYTIRAKMMLDKFLSENIIARITGNTREEE